MTTGATGQRLSLLRRRRTGPPSADGRRGSMTYSPKKQAG